MLESSQSQLAGSGARVTLSADCIFRTANLVERRFPRAVNVVQLHSRPVAVIYAHMCTVRVRSFVYATIDIPKIPNSRSAVLAPFRLQKAKVRETI